MRVLHVITDQDRRGAQVYASDLAGGLQALGVENEVVALAPGRNEAAQLDVEVLGPARRSPTTLAELRRRARSWNVVVAHGSSTLLGCSVALAGTRIPFVYRQISDPLHWAGTIPRRLRVAAMIRRASAIVALSNGAADVLVEHYRLSRDRITIVPNAVPAGTFGEQRSDESAEFRARHGVPADAVLALSLSALVEEKGVDMSIEAAVGIPGLHLVIAGDGPDRERLVARASALDGARVHFVGALDDPATALRASDLLVLPSRAGDSMPAAVIEAGLSSLACIATPVGSITDVVVGGRTGVIVPVGNQLALSRALHDLSSDADERRRLGEAAQRRCIENFTIESTAPIWLELLRSVAHENRRGPSG